MLTKTYLNDLEYKVMGACIEVHKHIGPGLLESVYCECLAKEFELRGIDYTSEYPLLINYKGLKLDTILSADFVIEDVFILEIKAVDDFHPIHTAKMLTYMQLLESPKGLMVNFNTTNIYHQGRKSFVNELFRNLPE